MRGAGGLFQLVGTMTDHNTTTLTVEKQRYSAPTVEVVGSFEALTKWAASGGGLDSPFSAGTPIASLTFSDPPTAS